ncbi:MAG TPA: arylamine N-acetyltransferase [Caulobacteraceae bacterium]|nr:arylamine N-acetyltransferase [Caulobacteraceae bacterium]
MSDIDLDAYFARIGYDGPALPTLATLRALAWLHPAAIPFETIDTRLGRLVSLSPEAVDAKLIGAGRGGYCFEQNTLLRRALIAIGYEVEILVGRPRWRRALEDMPPRTHMALRVRLDGQDWLIDAGSPYCVTTAPLRMDTAEPQATFWEPMRLTPMGGELRLEVLIVDDWRPVCDFVREPQDLADLEAPNWYVATNPTHAFHTTLMVSRITPGRRLSLVDNVLTVRRRGVQAERRRLDADDMAAVLADDFRLPAQPGWRALFEEIAAAAEAPLASSPPMRDRTPQDLLLQPGSQS